MNVFARIHANKMPEIERSHFRNYCILIRLEQDDEEEGKKRNKGHVMYLFIKK